MGKKSFTDQMRGALKKSGKTRYSISQATGIPQGSLSRFVNGLAGLSPESLDKIADLLGWELHYKAAPAGKQSTRAKSTSNRKAEK